MSSSKVKIDLEFRNGTRETYTVKKCVNTLDPKPGDALSGAEAKDLVRYVSQRGGVVTIKEAKKL